MYYDAKTHEEYLAMIPEDQREIIRNLREVIKKNLPEGFEEGNGSGMIGFVVPLSRYPKGYHTTPGEPLPFIGLAAQKNHIAVYHMALYADANLHKWFTDEYAKRVTTKLDMGKSCIRLKSKNSIPYELFGELAKKITVDEYVAWYVETMEKYRKK